MDQSAVNIAIVKLEAIKAALERSLSREQQLVFPFDEQKDYFTRYANCLTVLKEKHPFLFEDIPTRELPLPDPRERRRMLGRSDLEQLYNDNMDILTTWRGFVQYKVGANETLDRIFLQFHRVATQLQNRYSGRSTLTVNDEYDVQDLVHSLLWIDFRDIRKEEWVPSYAGSASRVDFLLKQEQTIIEAKKTRKGLGDRDLGEQLLVDIAKYQSHPDCKFLYCFVYDPDHRLVNPRGIEADLSKKHGDLPVKVVIVP